MLKKIKNVTNNDIAINDMGITVSAQSVYDLADKSYDTSNDLMRNVGQGAILVIKHESPEELYTIAESLQYLINGIVQVPKTSETGENVILNNEYGHLPANDVINWTASKYLMPDDSFSETMYIPLEKSITLNTFASGSFNTSSSAVLELFVFSVDYNDYIRVNPDIRKDEYYMAKITTPITSNTAELIVTNIEDFETDLVYQIETNDQSKVYRKIQSIDVAQNKIIFDLAISDYTKIVPTGKVTLVDRPIAENNSQITTTKTNWITPLRFSGIDNKYLKLTLTNEDESEPGIINSTINGWIGVV